MAALKKVFVAGYVGIIVMFGISAFGLLAFTGMELREASKQACTLLAQMRQLSGDGLLVFPSPFYPGKPPSDGTLNLVTQ